MLPSVLYIGTRERSCIWPSEQSASFGSYRGQCGCRGGAMVSRNFGYTGILFTIRPYSHTQVACIGLSARVAVVAGLGDAGPFRGTSYSCGRVQCGSQRQGALPGPQPCSVGYGSELWLCSFVGQIEAVGEWSLLLVSGLPNMITMCIGIDPMGLCSSRAPIGIGGLPGQVSVCRTSGLFLVKGKNRDVWESKETDR